MKNSMFFKIVASCSILCILFAFTQSNKGLEIAKKSKLNDSGFENYSVEVKMIITNKNGQTTTNLLTQKNLEVKNDGDKSLIEFNSPKDVKDTKTLTFTHKTKEDDQWIFLPAIKRVKRIASSNKSGPFIGSEFAFEDLSSFEVEKYEYKFIKETKINNQTFAIVETNPIDKKSGYSKQIIYFNLDEDYRVEKIEFFDRKGAKLKTLDYVNFKKYAGKHWRADKLAMVNHQNGKKTDLIFSDYKFKTNLNESDFTEESIKN